MNLIIKAIALLRSSLENFNRPPKVNLNAITNTNYEL